MLASGYASGDVEANKALRDGGSDVKLTMEEVEKVAGSSSGCIKSEYGNAEQTYPG
jgi:hypothetical protein